MEKFIANPKLKLREQLRELMRFKHYSLRTEEAYWFWIKKFILFHGKRHPREMGAAEAQSFLTHLASERNVAAATQSQALNALVFLYRELLQMPLGAIGEIETPKRMPRLPTVLSKDEVARLMEAVSPSYQLFFKLLYGTGMRLLESEQELLKLAMEGAKKDGRIALMMLERRFPESWRKREPIEGRVEHLHAHATVPAELLRVLAAQRKA